MRPWTKGSIYDINMVSSDVSKRRPGDDVSRLEVPVSSEDEMVDSEPPLQICETNSGSHACSLTAVSPNM